MEGQGPKFVTIPSIGDVTMTGEGGRTVIQQTIFPPPKRLITIKRFFYP